MYLQTIAQSTGRSMAQVKSDIAATGDIGIVAEQSRSNQRMMFKPAPLTVQGVYEKLKEIAQMTGQAVSVCFPRGKPFSYISFSCSVENNIK